MQKIITIIGIILFIFIVQAYISFHVFPSKETCLSELTKYSYGNPSVSSKRANQCRKILKHE